VNCTGGAAAGGAELAGAASSSIGSDAPFFAPVGGFGRIRFGRGWHIDTTRTDTQIHTHTLTHTHTQDTNPSPLLAF